MWPRHKYESVRDRHVRVLPTGTQSQLTLHSAHDQEPPGQMDPRLR